MLRRVRETAPAGLVPAAWTVVTLAHLGTVTGETLLIAHVVMDLALVAFAALSWSDMTDGALRAWRDVLVVGLAFTLVGTYGLSRPDAAPILTGLALYAWMLLPAGGLAATAQRVPAEDRPRIYGGGAALSVLGAAVYAADALLGVTAAAVAGLVLVGIGQTAGIVNAVVQ